MKKAGIKDISEIQMLAEKSWKSSYKGILSDAQIDYMLTTMYSVNEIISQMENPNYHYYFVMEDNIKLGFVGFECHYETNTTKLHRLYLVDEAKGKGLGKKAIGFIKDFVLQYNNSRIILNVNKQNSATAFYNKIGFKKYDEGVFDIGEGYVMDDFLMELKF